MRESTGHPWILKYVYNKQGCSPSYLPIHRSKLMSPLHKFILPLLKQYRMVDGNALSVL
jgi:hypothetical protein